MIDHIFSFFLSHKKALAILFMIICLAFIYPGMFKFLYVEGRDFGRSLVIRSYLSKVRHLLGGVCFLNKSTNVDKTP